MFGYDKNFYCNRYFEKKLKSKNLIKILKVIGKNNNFNNFLIKFADRGVNL